MKELFHIQIEGNVCLWIWKHCAVWKYYVLYVYLFICTYVLYVRTVFHWDLFATCKVIDMYVCIYMYKGTFKCSVI